MFHRESGHLDEELVQMQGALPYYYKVTGNHGYGVAKLMEAEIAYMRGHFDQAEICMCQAKRQAQEWNQYGILTDVLLLEMQLLFIKGDWERDVYKRQHLMGNSLQKAAGALCPEVEAACEALQSAGALGSVMSGSGSAVLGLFADEAGLDAAHAALSGRYPICIRTRSARASIAWL